MATIAERINKAKQDNRKVNGKGTAAQSIEERIRMAKQDSAPVMGGTHSAPSGAVGTTSPVKGEAGGVGASTATLGKSDIEQRMKQAGVTIFSANQRITGYSRAGNMGKALEEEREKLKAAQAEYDSLKQQLALLQQNEALAKRAQEFAEGNETYNALTQQDDFAAYSSVGASKDNSGSVPGNIVRYYRENEHPLYSAMTEQEVSIYDYLLGKGDAAGAQKYLEFLNEDLRRREGEAKAQEIQDIENPVERTLATGAHAFKAGVDNAMQGTVQFFRDEEMPTSATQFASAALMEDMGTWGRYAYSAVNTVGNMLPSIVVGTLTGGAGGAAAMGLSSSGNAYKQALTEGYDKSDARAYSVLVGASEAALQYAIGGISKLGGVADDVLLAKALKLDKAYKRMLATGAIKLGSEITEEEVQLFLEPAIKSIIMDVPYDAPNFEEMVETAIVTALSTGALEGGNILAAGANRPVQSGQTKNAASGVETAVNENGLTALTEQEKTNLSSGKKNKVISSFNEAVGFIKNALSNKQSVDRAYLGKVPDGVAKRVLEETGVDITGYNAILPSDAVRHMFKNHGNETAEMARGQVALTAETAANITTVLSNPDRVYLSDKTDARGLSTLIFEKQIGDYYITAQAVSDGTHSIQTDTLYVQKKKNPQDTVSDASVSTAPVHNARSVPPQGSSTNNTIPHTADSVNSGAVQGFGENGTRVITEIAENSGMTMQKAQEKVRLAYQTGRSNLPGTQLDLTDIDQRRAYNAGKMDFLTADRSGGKDLVNGQETLYTKTEGAQSNEEAHLRGSGQRADGTNPGGAVSAVESRTGGNQVRQEQGRPADPEAASLTYGEAVSTASLGIGKGSEDATVRVVTGGDTADTRAAKQLAKERGLRLTLFVGGNLSINGESVRAYITGDRAFVRADHPDFTSAQLMRHEAGHDMIAKGEIDPQTVRERIAERFDGEQLDRVTQMYIEAYAGSGLTAEEIWEEVICDSLGDMNIFSETVSEDAARELLTATKTASADAKAETSRGPPQSIAGKASREITTPAAQNAIFDALDHKDNGDDNLILLSQMPGAIRDIADVDGDLYVYRNHLYENMVDEKRAQTEGRYNPNGHYHELGEEVMEQALTALNHPSIVIADEMKAGNPALTLILPIFDKRDWPIHAVLSFYDRSAINGKTEKRPHIAVTFYGHYYEDDGGRKTVVDLVNDAIDGDRVLLLDKKVRADLPLIAERAPLGNVTVSALKRNIAQFQKRVKQFKTANKINYSIELEPAKIERAAERYSTLIEEYGSIAPGENPARDIQVPKKTADTSIELDKSKLERATERYKKALDKVRADRDAKLKKLKAEHRAKEAVGRERRKARELRQKIERHVSELSRKLLRPNDKKHIPQALQGPVARLLEAVNLESQYTIDPENGKRQKTPDGLPNKRTKAFAELKAACAEIKGDLVIDPELLGEDGAAGLLDEVLAMADTPIAAMNSEQLTTMWKTIRAVEASITSTNKLFKASRFKTVGELAQVLREDNKGKSAKAEYNYIGGLQKLTGLDMMTPETFLHRLGSAGDTIFRMMRNAQDEHIRIMKETADFTREALAGINVRKLEKELHTVTLGGEEVTLSTAQLMELYALMRREQAQNHIYKGGILPDAVSGKGLKKNVRTEAVQGISEQEVLDALELLTDEQMELAEKLQDYASNTLSGHGNKASMAVYNYEKFNEEHYWPIRSNRRETHSDVQKDTQVTTVANRGFTKAVKPNANTSVCIGSIFDTFANHASEMATYAAWLEVTEDINRIRNFVFRDKDGNRTGSVKGIIDRVHGSKGSDYLSKLLGDIANGVKSTHGQTEYMGRIVGNYKAAAVGANLRVVIQQPTAILRAMDMIDPKYLVMGMKPGDGWKKALKYAPIAQWKDWGYFDINTGRQMKDVLFDSAGGWEKARQGAMWLAGKMDSLAWGQLWNACEMEVREQMRKTGGLSFAEILESPLRADQNSDTIGAERHSLKEELEHDRARKETREDFKRRCLEEGYSILDGKGGAYGFRRAGDGHSADTGALGEAAKAFQAKEELKSLGINAEVVEGPVLINRNGITRVRKVKEAATVARSQIFISKHATLPPRNVAGHEAFHLWSSGVNRDAYIEAVEDNLLFTSEDFRYYQSVVAETYCGEEVDLTDIEQSERFFEELIACISGDIHEGVNDDLLRPMFRDFDAVKTAWNGLVQANSGDTRFLLKNGAERSEGNTLTPTEADTEAFYRAVAERFTQIIDHTQVVDGILQRSQIMRDPSAWAKMATSFMGEPTKQYNMMMYAVYDAKNGSKEQRSAGRKRLARTVFALAAAGLVNAAAQSIMDAVRDDDDEKEYWEKWMEAFGKNAANMANPAQYVPYVKDVASVVQGYDVSRMDMESIEKTFGAAKNFIKALGGEGKYSVPGASANLFAEGARLLGIPVANFKRDVISFAKLWAVETDSYLMQYHMQKGALNLNYYGNSGEFMDILYNAYANDREAYEIIYADMVKSGYDADKIKSGMETRMKKAQGVESVADLKERYLAPEQSKQYEQGRKKLAGSALWKKATVQQRKAAEDDLYEMIAGTDDGERLKEKVSDGAVYGLSESEYLLYRLALSMADEPNDSGGMGTYTNAEVERAIDMVSGLTDAERSYLWLAQGKHPTSNPYD